LHYTASTQFSTLSLHDALPIFNFNLVAMDVSVDFVLRMGPELVSAHNRKLIELMFERLPKDRFVPASPLDPARRGPYGCFAARRDRKSTRLNSSHVSISYAVFC